MSARLLIFLGRPLIGSFLRFAPLLLLVVIGFYVNTRVDENFQGRRVGLDQLKQNVLSIFDNSVDISRETESGLERNKVLDQEALQQLLSCENVKHLEKTRLLEVVGDVSGVTGVRIKQPGGSDGDDDDEVLLDVEGAFIYGAGAGSKPITDFCQSKIALDEDGGVIVDANMQTSVEGVYAIGDIRNTDYKQVVVAASDGCIAAMSIEKFLNNRKMVKVDWIHK